MRLVEQEERWEASDHSQGVLLQNWVETDLNRSVTCIMLKATDNDRRHLALCNDEFHGHLLIRIMSGGIPILLSTVAFLHESLDRIRIVTRNQSILK
ncbi:hypothetical protein TNCV_3686931 [Trichonephila clavipes]|nr:hypothetical protein TNCV_3686931 [Trichonephila clavipes]